MAALAPVSTEAKVDMDADESLRFLSFIVVKTQAEKEKLDKTKAQLLKISQQVSEILLSASELCSEIPELDTSKIAEDISNLYLQATESVVRISMTMIAIKEVTPPPARERTPTPIPVLNLPVDKD